MTQGLRKHLNTLHLESEYMSLVFTCYTFTIGNKEAI